jgi:hypothetical protein
MKGGFGATKKLDARGDMKGGFGATKNWTLGAT